MDLEAYRESESEKARTADLLRILPRKRDSILDVGARDGHFSKLLTQFFPSVTALDLTKPGFHFPGVTTAAGDATQLDFADDSFDVVFCAEVLEHIPGVEKACSEIARVAKHEIVIGVPYRQDTRLGRTTCQRCGRISPPWGHVNSFTRERLLGLFPACGVVTESFIGTNRDATNALATWLMDRGGNPWGTYTQGETCLHCGSMLQEPGVRPFWRKVCSGLAARMNAVQARFTAPAGNWIHLVFAKRQEEQSCYSSR